MQLHFPASKGRPSSGNLASVPALVAFGSLPQGTAKLLLIVQLIICGLKGLMGHSRVKVQVLQSEVR